VLLTPSSCSAFAGTSADLATVTKLPRTAFSVPWSDGRSKLRDKAFETFHSNRPLFHRLDRSNIVFWHSRCRCVSANALRLDFRHRLSRSLIGWRNSADCGCRVSTVSNEVSRVVPAGNLRLGCCTNSCRGRLGHSQFVHMVQNESVVGAQHSSRNGS